MAHTAAIHLRSAAKLINMHMHYKFGVQSLNGMHKSRVPATGSRRLWHVLAVTPVPAHYFLGGGYKHNL